MKMHLKTVFASFAFLLLAQFGRADYCTPFPSVPGPGIKKKFVFCLFYVY